MRDMNRAGTRDCKLRFEIRSSPADDSFGNMEGAWLPLCTAWASCLPRRSGGRDETVLAGRLAARALYTIIVLQSAETAAIDETCRAVDLRSGAVFNIRSKVDLDGLARDWTMDAERGVAI